MIFETSRYTNLQFKIIRKNSQTWMDPRLQFNTSDLKELPMDWKFLSKVTDSFFVTVTFGKVDILSQQMCYPMQCLQQYLSKVAVLTKIFINIVGNNSHSLPLALMEASAESNLPYAQLSFAWQSTLLFNVHRSGGLTHSSSTEETPICTRSDIPFSWSLPFITLQLFHEHHTSIWLLQSGKPTKKSAN